MERRHQISEERPVNVAEVTYTNGKRSVPIINVCDLPNNITRNKYALVRGHEPLREWCEHMARHDCLTSEESPHIKRLATLVATLLNSLDPDCIRGHKFTGDIGNVIVRCTDSTASSRVHRDLDEMSVRNLTERGFSLFYNAWVPLTPVTAYPLGLLLPDTVDGTDVASFHPSIEHDRTSLRANESHRWVYFDGLKPGDMIVWHSSIVYHTALNIPSPIDEPRRSIDLRIFLRKEHSAPG